MKPFYYKFVFSFLLITLLFLSCEEEIEYDIQFDKTECMANYNIWKQHKPVSYSFEYVVGQSASGIQEMGEVTVSGESKTVDLYVKKPGQEKIRYEDFVNELNSSDDSAGTDIHYEVPDENWLYHIDSIDSLFDKTIAWYEKYETDINNKNLDSAYFSAEYDTDYSFISSVSFTVNFEDHSGLKGHDGDDIFALTITDFKILDE